MANLIIQQALLQQQIAMEKVMERSERHHTFGQRIKMSLIEKFVSLPSLTFEDEDVDQEIVAKLLKHPKVLDTIDEWTWGPDEALNDRLRSAQPILLAIQKPMKHKKLYRGFDLKNTQNHMGTRSTNWYGGGKTDAKPGDKMSYVSEYPLSFTYHEGTAKSFGTVIVSIDPTKYKNRMIDITHELVAALYKHSDIDHRKIGYYLTEAETIILPSDQPIEFTVESVAGKKN